jgi:hypothetical protein
MKQPIKKQNPVLAPLPLFSMFFSTLVMIGVGGFTLAYHTPNKRLRLLAMHVKTVGFPMFLTTLLSTNRLLAKIIVAILGQSLSK